MEFPCQGEIACLLGIKLQPNELTSSLEHGFLCTLKLNVKILLNYVTAGNQITGPPGPPGGIGPVGPPGPPGAGGSPG